MSKAWETTLEDVEYVLAEHGIVGMPIEHIKALHYDIDASEVELAALYGLEMEDQCKYVYEEIWNQLVELGVRPPP